MFFGLLNTLEQLLLRLDGYITVQFKVKGVQVLNTTPNFISILWDKPTQILAAGLLQSEQRLQH